MIQPRLFRSICRVALLIAGLATVGLPAFAQGAAQVQELAGNLSPNEYRIYNLPGLRQGDRLYFYMETTSGNLDPLAGLLKGDQAPLQALQSYQSDVQQALQSGEDPRQAIQVLRDRYLLAWDDDSGTGYAAAFEFTVPADGDYSLVVGGSLSAAGRSTAGDYRLLVKRTAWYEKDQRVLGEFFHTALITNLAAAPAFQPTEASRRRLQDLALAAKTKASLKSHRETARLNVDVLASDGAITLRGSVPETKHRQETERITRSIPGVRGLTSELIAIEDRRTR